MSATVCRTAAVLTVPLAAGAGARRHQIAQSTTNTNTVSSTRVALRASRRLAVMRAKDSDDVDWEAKTKEMTAERVIEKCMEAMADGDEDLLQSCLLELEEPEEKASVMESLMEEKSDDEFWKNKLSEIAAERVLDNCMSAVVRPCFSVASRFVFLFLLLLVVVVVFHQRSSTVFGCFDTTSTLDASPPNPLHIFLQRRSSHHHKHKSHLPKTLSLPLSPLLRNSQMYGEVDDIEDCMLDAQNDTLLSADFSTAEDGSKTFKF